MRIDAETGVFGLKHPVKEIPYATVILIGGELAIVRPVEETNGIRMNPFPRFYVDCREANGPDWPLDTSKCVKGHAGIPAFR